MKLRPLILFFLVALAIGKHSAAAEERQALDVYLTPQILVTLPDGRHVHFFCQGTGEPTAIINSGWATWSTGWRVFQPKLAKITRVCAFDRAGYGFSDPGPMPRDEAATVADLHSGLQAAGLKPPYVMIGHSQGGFDARLFAYRYPDEVAGLLLIDPPTERIYQRNREPDEDLDSIRHCIELAKTRKLIAGDEDDCVPSPAPDWSPAMRAHQIEVLSKISLFETEISEDSSMVGISADELAEARHSLGDIPLIILQADTAAEVERTKELEDQARDSTLGKHVIVAGAKHYIHADKPDVVLAALREIIDVARAKSGAIP